MRKSTNQAISTGANSFNQRDCDAGFFCVFEGGFDAFGAGKFIRCFPGPRAFLPKAIFDSVRLGVGILFSKVFLGKVLFNPFQNPLLRDNDTIFLVSKTSTYGF